MPEIEISMQPAFYLIKDDVVLTVMVENTLVSNNLQRRLIIKYTVKGTIQQPIKIGNDISCDLGDTRALIGENVNTLSISDSNVLIPGGEWDLIYVPSFTGEWYEI